MSTLMSIYTSTQRAHTTNTALKNTTYIHTNQFVFECIFTPVAPEQMGNAALKNTAYIHTKNEYVYSCVFTRINIYMIFFLPECPWCTTSEILHSALDVTKSSRNFEKCTIYMHIYSYEYYIGLHFQSLRGKCWCEYTIIYILIYVYECCIFRYNIKIHTTQ